MDGVTDRLFIGIPVLNRPDLLARCLAAVDHPADVVVVNNSVDPGVRAAIAAAALAAADEAAGRRVQVLSQRRNLGVAASWNLIARTGFAAGHDWVFVGSNDTRLCPGSLRAAAAAPKEPDVRVWHLCDWNFFLIRRSTIEDVGWFDENFYPAYEEDRDYAYRCTLAGVRRADVPGAGGDHVGSATIKSDPRYAALNAVTHGTWNANHYRMKWGGDAGAERFRTPYGLPDRDHRWWPDPGGSIAARDWDGPAGRAG